MKKVIAAILSTVMILTGCGTSQTNTKVTEKTNNSSSSKLKVLTSFNAIDKLVKKIGADKVETNMLVNGDVEPHDFELKAKDMEKVKDYKILFINGLDMEHWAEKLPETNKELQLIDLSKGVDTIKSPNFDPHIWLGVKELKVMAKNVENALSQADSNNKETYKSNADKFIQELEAVEKEYNPKFESHKGKGFITGHEAFAYLCRNIGLTQKAVEGVFGEGEPTPQKIKELVDFVKTNNISTVFLEENASPKVSETIAKETKTKLVIIPTLETEGEIIDSIKEIYNKVLESLK